SVTGSDFDSAPTEYVKRLASPSHAALAYLVNCGAFRSKSLSRTSATNAISRSAAETGFPLKGPASVADRFIPAETGMALRERTPLSHWRSPLGYRAAPPR